jgi:uncharacterized protein YjbI with pentapeptide repeats
MAKPREIEPAGKPTPSTTSEVGCPVNVGVGMRYSDEPCRRPLHNAPQGVDGQPVCLMHSKDPRKEAGALFEEFMREFEAILTTAGGGVASFQNFVFPGLSLAGRVIQAECWFENATFTQFASFNGANFTRDVDFTGAIFTKYTAFSPTTFTQSACFRKAVFNPDTHFTGANFLRYADFAGAIFMGDAHFADVTFKRRASFSGTTFKHHASFSRARFTEEAVFSGATFTDALFGDVIFTQVADFKEASFRGMADWRRSRFLESAEFHRTEFAPQGAGGPSAVFALVRFSKPGEIVFDDVDLSRALFNHRDVTEVWFTSSVRWGRRSGNRGVAVFEETIPLNQEIAQGLQRDGQRDFRAVAQIYQQLKKNYDARLDYSTANEFHFSEMEMKRLASPTDGPLLGLRHWWHARLSLVAWYRHASDYGNSYRRPSIWLLSVLLLFALLLPLPGVGLQRSGATHQETYASVWRAGGSVGQSLRWEVGLAGRSLLTAVDIATFQKSTEYTPAYPAGHALAIVETLLTSTLFALFLLAIRRQFRR